MMNLLVLGVVLLPLLATAQFKELGLEGYLGIGAATPTNESDGATFGLNVRHSFAYPIADPLQAELGIAFARLRADQYSGEIMPIDLRARFAPFHKEKWFPFVYAGIGLLHSDVSDVPDSADANADAGQAGDSGMPLELGTSISSSMNTCRSTCTAATI